jgi:hypothetical protein
LKILTCAGSFPFDAACLCHSASYHLSRPILRCYPYTAVDYDSLAVVVVVVESSTALASRAAAAAAAAADWAWAAFAAAPCRAAVDS